VRALRVLLCCLAPLLLVSCVVMHERDGDELDASGKVTKRGASKTYASLGGRGTYRIGKGLNHNHEKSFRDGAVLVGTVATGYFGAVTSEAVEATNQAALREGTAKHVSDNALKGKAIEANAAAHGQAIAKEVPGVVPAAAPPPFSP
jgi:hypothetical protein